MATKKQFFVSLEGVDLTDEQLKTSTEEFRM